MNAKTDDDWPWLGVYLYRRDGTYTRAMWIKGPEELEKLLPKIRERVRKRFEVRITNGSDELLFHARNGGIEWDGIGLKPLMPA
jgi:hypothetical protein